MVIYLKEGASFILMAICRIKVYNYTGTSEMNVNVEVGECVVVCALEKIEKVNRKYRLQHQKAVKHAIEHGGYSGSGLVVFSLVKVLYKDEGVGLDQWGVFYKLTTLEAKGYCFWCGVRTRGRYCSGSHRLQYLRHFNWSYARDWCWKRYSGHCGVCGQVSKPSNIDWRWRDLEVHHLDAINAGFREWTLLNRPENLILLCPPCHDLTKRKDFVGLSKEIVDSRQLVFL